jgi:LmbE family N-acetylglucosaminyl deacetylase
MFKFNRVLVIEPHPDDGFIGAGGLLARLRRENPKCAIWDTYLCPCIEDSRNEGILDEHKKSCEILEIENVITNTYPRNTFIEANKQVIRNFFFQLKEKFEPDLVLSPSIHDYHQDHTATAECVSTIFRNNSLVWHYEVPRSTSVSFLPNIFVSLTKEDVDKKVEALKCWKTQHKARPYFFYDAAFRSHLIYRGLQSNIQWAEAFEVVGKI